MPVHIFFAARPESWEIYAAPLRAALARTGLDAVLRRDFPPAQVDYIVYAPNDALRDFAPFTRLKAVLSLWAGVEDAVGNPSLRAPLTRMVDHGLRQGMTEWVTGHVLRHHLGLDRHIRGQDGIWRKDIPPLAQERCVAILGLGELGRASAGALAALGFIVTGWSRSPKKVDGIDCRHGPQGLKQALERAEIAVLLLPDTPSTRNILNRQSLGWMPRGAVVINPGRGTLIDDDALLATLDSGRLSHATLDVFRTEPLPAAHPFWIHEKVTVTPHIASATRPESACAVIAENIRRGESGEPLLYLVDRKRGY